MIPNVEDILLMLASKEISHEQAMAWMDEHFKMAMEEAITARPEARPYERCFDAAIEALRLLDSTRPTWNGPIHRAVAVLREATGPQDVTPMNNGSSKE
jgi:hypothetical protein